MNCFALLVAPALAMALSGCNGGKLADGGAALDADRRDDTAAPDTSSRDAAAAPDAAAEAPAAADAVSSPDASGQTEAGTGRSYPDRFTVGAPGVRRYTQADQTLPVPSGYTELWPHDSASKEYHLYSCGNVTLDHVYVHGFIYLGTGCHGTVTITNSIIAPPPGSTQRAILVNADASAPLTISISDTTIRPEPVPLGGLNNALTDHIVNGCATCTIHLNRVDVANAGGMCLCGENAVIENSWLHDAYIAHLPDPGVAHTGGVFPYGGSGPLVIRNNRLEPGFDVGTGQAVTDYWKAITAVLFTQSAGGSVLRNYSVYGNFISLGAYDMDLEDGQGLEVHDNVFGPNHFGYVGTCSSGCQVTYSDWSRNVVGDIDGTPATTPVNHP